ncbi:MAG: mechanosensitive ion channel family protein, partial [Gammaproteobacteria bacterium]|nr:mechanosensitive ion channel family protein [Gammaproteobacteria bacterium]
RYWVPTIRYFETRHAVNAAIYTALKEAGVDILPQREVHLVQGR